MIPKIIHYCWFGSNPMPDSAKKCVDSWKKFCPDYEIIEWNERNYDVAQNLYMKQAYESKKWGFVSDYARLDIIYRYGGIYLDTDVEIIKSFDSLLNYEGFMGFEQSGYVALGLGFGAAPQNAIIKEMKDMYESISFLNNDGTYNLTPCPHYQTHVLLGHGLVQNNMRQTVGGIEMFPSEYFCPMNFQTGKTNVYPETYSIHWYDASWLDPDKQYALRMRWKLNKLLPNTVAYNVSNFLSIAKFYGTGEAVKKTSEIISKKLFKKI